MAIIKVYDRLFTDFISSTIIHNRIQEIALELNERYNAQRPIFLTVLNGAFIFAADLMREITIECELSFVKIASYSGTKSTETIKQLIGFNENMENRHIIVIEDIIDTGLSMKHILEQLEQLKPASVAVVTLLLKKEALKHHVQVDYVGFEIANKFVLGYGLDFDGLGRNLPDIYAETTK
ncbi:MAG: hypoxanthine phosphoribosyltransferase [Bacteroidetes bacterium]|nr:MAG: hypoxanthine phosphoribosyltransferase [Bacteroidota bacterium]